MRCLEHFWKHVGEPAADVRLAGRLVAVIWRSRMHNADHLLCHAGTGCSGPSEGLLLLPDSDNSQEAEGFNKQRNHAPATLPR
jgi:hypothetical protein